MNLTKIMKVLFLALLLVGVSTALFAQSDTATASVEISPVALLDANTATAPSFTVAAPATAGDLPLITPAGGPTYLRYTVIVATGATKEITAECDLAMLPGLKLDIWAAAPTGTGDLGDIVPGGLTVDSTYTPATPADLITGIASCATGSGATQGPAVYYTLSIDASTFASMETAVSTEYTITYTMIDG